MARPQTGELGAADGLGGALDGDLFGSSVAIDGTTILAGAPGDDATGHVDQGSASVFFAPVPLPVPPAVEPVLTKLKVSPKTSRRGTALPKLARSKKGTRISFTLSAAASVKLSFGKAAKGRKVGKSCKKPTRSNRAERKCTRYKSTGSFTVSGKAGANKVSFASKLSKSKRLSLGNYKLTATPTNAGGKGTARTTKFKLARR